MRLVVATFSGYVGGLLCWLMVCVVMAFDKSTSSTWGLADVIPILLFPLIVFLFPYPRKWSEIFQFLAASAIAGLLGTLIPPVWEIIEFLLLPGPHFSSGLDWPIYALGIGTATFAGFIYLFIAREPAIQRILKES